MTWVIARLREPTTWIGLSSLLTLFGVNLAPELADAIIAVIAAIGGLLAIVLKEKGSR